MGVGLHDGDGQGNLYLRRDVFQPRARLFRNVAYDANSEFPKQRQDLPDVRRRLSPLDVDDEFGTRRNHRCKVFLADSLSFAYGFDHPTKLRWVANIQEHGIPLWPITYRSVSLSTHWSPCQGKLTDR